MSPFPAAYRQLSGPHCVNRVGSGFSARVTPRLMPPLLLAVTVGGITDYLLVLKARTHRAESGAIHDQWVRAAAWALFAAAIGIVDYTAGWPRT